MSHHSSVKLGIDLEELPSVTQAEIVRFPSAESCDEAGEVQADHFVVRNGKCYAGTHLIIDLWEAEHLDNLEQVERALREALAYSPAPFHAEWRRLRGGRARGIAHLDPYLAGALLCGARRLHVRQCGTAENRSGPGAGL
jgi:hypothetical protein